MKFVYKIKEQRLEKSYTQEFVAKELDVCRTTYGNLENAKDYSLLKYISELTKIFEFPQIFFYKLNPNWQSHPSNLYQSCKKFTPFTDLPKT
ncbi:MAG: helix-turn-helix domain-containing protein [Chlorobi bacterium]|jgi:DNA-binding XRE family transcriptional regulator|nr:helix-turn-helix domain-containing protein [Chlorobiota bacterium]